MKISTFLTDISQLAEMRDVRVRYLPDPPPASTTVQVAALFRPQALIEVEVVAASPRRAQAVAAAEPRVPVLASECSG